MSTDALVTKNLKIVLLGESEVGKTSIALSYTKSSFDENQASTVGAAFFSKEIISEGVTYRFEIWDTAGQERFRSLAPMYYRNAHAALVVYDITNIDTFKAARKWIDELKNNEEQTKILYLIGNKADRALEERKVPKDEALEFADMTDIKHEETSAKTGDNIEKVFDEICNDLIEMYKNEEDKQLLDINKSISSTNNFCGC